VLLFGGVGAELKQFRAVEVPGIIEINFDANS
jgi:hypothetical protein